MPSTSAKQARLMAAVAHSPAFAKKVGIPQSVGKDFNAADKGKTFKASGRTDQQTINRPKTNHGSTALFSRGGEMKESKAMEMRHVAAMKKAGVPKKYVKEEEAEAAAMKRSGKVKKMADGGMAMDDIDRAKRKRKPAPQEPDDGNTYKRGGSIKKMAKGGFTKAADGIASRGKTKAQQFKRGGKC